jgi:endonuclease YncB( thermonuclease family)
MYGIDAPEKGMPYSNAAKKYLSGLCFGKKVQVKIVTTDMHGRSVAKTYLSDGRELSHEMLRAGYAWHFKQYSSDQDLAALEIEARNAKRGLWQQNNPLSPWDVRKLHRNGISTKKQFQNSVR